MLKSQKLTLRASEIRAKLNDLSGLDSLDDDQRAELDRLSTEYRDVESQRRAAILAEDEGVTTPAEPDAEMRERVELRSRASLTTFFTNAAKGRLASGAERELQSAAGVGEGIPLELWDVQTETRAVTAAPGTGTGVNLDPIRPQVFAASIAPRLSIEMPRVPSGTFSSATISTGLTAAAKAKSGAATATAAALTVSTATPKRVSARLELTLEDIASVGAENFESALRENLSLALSDALDTQVINGNGTSPNLTGMLQRLTDPSAPDSGVETWTRFLAIQSGGIDGLWAARLSDIAIVVNPETYRLACGTFQGNDSEESAASYLERMGGGFWTNSRMPAKASHIAQGILHRKGRTGVRTALCPHWGEVGVDDITSGSAKGERYFTLHVLLGDVIVTQPGAYSQVAFRVSTS